MYEREQERRHRGEAATAEDYTAPGRGNASAGLSRPDQPRSSGILMRKGSGEAGNADAAAELASTSTGSALPDELREKFEHSLGTDLSSVRVHTGGESEVATSAVSARAFAMGQDIHFGAGQYDPSTSDGQHLIAHEVAHTVQQRGGSSVRQNKLSVSQAHDPLEVEADRAADAMVAGRAAMVSSGGLAIAREGGSMAAPPPPPGMTMLKNLQPVAAAVKAGEASGGGSIPSPAGLYDVAERNYTRNAQHCTNVQSHYSAKGAGIDLPVVGEIKGNAYFQGFAKTAGEANKYCENGAILSSAASAAIGMWIPLLQNSQDSWADVKTAAEKAHIDTVKGADGTTSLEAEGVDEEGKQLKGYDRLVNTKEVKDAAPGASAKEKADVQRQKESTSKDTASGKNVDPQAKIVMNEAATNFENSMTAVNRSRADAVKKHGAARGSLLEAKKAANSKRQSAAEEQKKGIDDILAMVDKAQSAIEKGRGAVETAGKFGEVNTGPEATSDKTPMNDGHKDMEKAADGVLGGIKASAIAKAILQIDGTIPEIEGEIAACKARDENLKGIIDEGAIKAAGGAYVDALKRFKEDLATLKDRVTKYEAAHKAYAEVVNQALIKRGLIKHGDDGVKPVMELLAKVRIASASTQSAIEATGDVLAAVGEVNGLGAPPTPDVCQLSNMAAAHSKAFGTAPSHVKAISALLTARQAKLKSYVEKLGV